MPETATAEPTVQDHFSAAVAEHSKEPAQADTSSTVAAETGDTETATQPAENSENAAEPVAEPADQLLTKEEVAKLTPEQQDTYKRMQASYTQKTQTLAAERKQVEALKGFVAAMEADPIGAIRQLAEANGLKLADTPKTEQKVETVADDAIAAIQAAVEEGGLIDMQKLAQGIVSIVKKGVAEEVKPLKQHQDQLLAETAARQTEAVLQTFTKKHPDWQKHDAKMAELGQKLQPTKAMDESEYMEMLYHLATRDIQSAEQTKGVMAKMNKAAAAAETSDSGVQPNRVSQRAPAGEITMAQALADAKRGIRYED